MKYIVVYMHSMQELLCCIIEHKVLVGAQQRSFCNVYFLMSKIVLNSAKTDN